jgi:hypothetical protein
VQTLASTAQLLTIAVVYCLRCLAVHIAVTGADVVPAPLLCSVRAVHACVSSTGREVLRIATCTASGEVKLTYTVVTHSQSIYKLSCRSGAVAAKPLLLMCKPFYSSSTLHDQLRTPTAQNYQHIH